MSNKHFDRKTQRILTMMIVALVGLLVYAAASDAGGETKPGRDLTQTKVISSPV